MRILLVEDDDSVSKILEKSLVSEHYAVDVASDGQAGWQLVNSFDYDLIVLDVMLPKLDGIQFCQRLRDCSYHMPVLLVTALDSSTQKIAGLDAGADDYITKPFELEELLARVRVLLRRTQTPLLSVLAWGELQLDPNSREVTYGDRPVKLTPKEFRLLELFLRKQTQVFSRGAILDSLWSCSEAPGEDTVTAHIRGLRRKLISAGAPSDLIKTVYGVGYRLKPLTPAENGVQAENGTCHKSPAASVNSDSDPNLAARHQQTKAALITLWQSVKSQHLERLEILKQAVQTLQDQHLTDDLRQEATQAAHSLTGALGIFGLKSGSELARSIEHMLRGDAPLYPYRQKQLADRVNTLDEELNQALGQLKQLEQPQPGSVPSLFVLIDNNQLLLEQLAKALQTQSLTVQIAVDEADLRQLTTPQSPPVAATALPDVVLFNSSLADSNEATLLRVSRLINQVLPLLVLVCSADGSLASRVRAAQLGNHSFLHNPDVTTVLKGVLRVRSRLQQHSHKVLAVDDDPQILEALRALLEPRGLQLITLNQPLDFWPTLQAASPDLLLLDIEMPKFSGLELCRVVRQAPVWNRLPIIFFTAHDDASTKAAALRAGANDLVEKSLAGSALLDRLFEQLKRSQLQVAMAAIAESYA
ncbi:MAG: response regulator [Leptolyngbya sp. SIO1E4]|nr:response regulator [Leptolyngbya sp. SIO1E4]